MRRHAWGFLLNIFATISRHGMVDTQVCLLFFGGVSEHSVIMEEFALAADGARSSTA